MLSFTKLNLMGVIMKLDDFWVYTADDQKYSQIQRMDSRHFGLKSHA